MNLLLNLKTAIELNKKRNAFFINQSFYTYNDFAQAISNIRACIKSNVINSEVSIGLVTNDDLQTYASIIALWLEGKAYVPINQNFPIERNDVVINLSELKTILDSSSEHTIFTNTTILKTNSLKDQSINLHPNNGLSEQNLAYIFFTSGTTGTPKGVPITIKNLTRFIDAFSSLNYPITHEDRCLQMFELTFDLSVFSYLAPLLNGASIYTIPKDEIKYSYIFELMEDYELTYSLMVPSMLHYLRPYFDEINCPKMKYSLFCGEALPLDVTEEWSKCLPNATIANVYGPTECTIFCTDYTFNPSEDNLTHNGVLSIGKDMKNTLTVIVDNANNIVETNQKGELCLSGDQLTSGYWKNENKNNEAFFNLNIDSNILKFYRTGDLCSKDEEGNILYLGRIDFQTKIQGYRVELSEIEFHVKNTLEKTNSIAIAFENKIKNAEIGLVIESNEFSTETLIENLKTKLPTYMLPTQIKFINNFPLNSNGKTDRKKLKALFF